MTNPLIVEFWHILAFLATVVIPALSGLLLFRQRVKALQSEAAEERKNHENEILLEDRRRRNIEDRLTALEGFRERHEEKCSREHQEMIKKMEEHARAGREDRKGIYERLGGVESRLEGLAKQFSLYISLREKDRA